MQRFVWLEAALATLLIWPVPAAPQPFHPENDRCASALASPRVEHLRDAAQRSSANLLALAASFDVSEAERASALVGFARDLNDELSRLSDLASIAVNMETANDFRLVRPLLQRYATTTLTFQSQRTETISNVLALSKSPRLIAEARALRDEVEEFVSLLQLCRA